MAGNTVFEYTVKGILHDAIPITPSEALDLTMGDVIVYEKTPSKWRPWRKHHLVYSGININDVLNSPVAITTEEAVLYDDATFTRSVSDSVGLDADVKTALTSFGVKFDISEKKTLTGEFGQVKRMLWNLRNEVIKKTFRGSLKMDHPIVENAKRHGSILFVVTHLYQSAKVHVQLDETLIAGISGDGKLDGSSSKTTEGSDGDTISSTASVVSPSAIMPGSGSVKTDDKGSITTKGGITRSGPTNIGFRLLGFMFDSKGNLSMKMSSDLAHAKVKSPDEVDSGGAADIAVLRQDSSCPHTLGAHDVEAYCSKQKEEEKA